MNRAELKRILEFSYDTKRVFGFVRDGFDKTSLILPTEERDQISTGACLKVVKIMLIINLLTDKV